MTTRAHTVVPSPIGPLTVVREDDALVRLAMSPPAGLDAEALGVGAGEPGVEQGRDLQQVLALQEFGFAVNALHDPWEFVRVHPWADVREEFGRPGLDTSICHILETESVGVPIIMHIADCCL